MKEQQLARAIQNQNGNSKTFIPNCNPAGGYERMQCDSSVGECWCVNKMGDEEPGTRIRGNKKFCDAPGKSFIHDFVLFHERHMEYRYFIGGKRLWKTLTSLQTCYLF